MSSLSYRKSLKKISFGAFLEQLRMQPVQKAAPGMSRRAFFGGMVAVAVLTHPVATKAAYLPFTKPYWNALDYGITGNGSTNDAAAINTFITNATNAGAAVYFPGGKTYELGSTSLSVPDNGQVMAAANAIFRRSTDQGTAGSWDALYGVYTGAMISLGNKVSWIGGELTNTAVLATSSSSVTNSVASGKVFTIAAGANIKVGSFLRIESISNPANHMEGVVTAYAGTSLTYDAQFSGGSAGPFTDWRICAGAVFQCSMALHGVSETHVSRVRITGNWYVGIIFEGWNPSTGGSLLTNNCSLRNSYVVGAQNRGVYNYGATSDNVFESIWVNGLSGKTDYGFNNNPANATGSVNAQQRNKYVSCDITSVGFQGMAFGDAVYYNEIIGCGVNNVTASAGVGILIQAANTGFPQYISVTGCTVNNCPSAGLQNAGAFATNVNGLRSLSNGIGLLVSAGTNSSGTINSGKCSFQNLHITANTTGVSVAANQTETLLTGRSFSNTTNLSNSGTGTVSTNLLTV